MRQFLYPLAISVLFVLGLQLVFSAYVICANYKEQKRRMYLYRVFDWNGVFASAFDLTVTMPYAVVFAAWTALYAAETTASRVLFGLLALFLTFRGLRRLR